MVALRTPAPKPPTPASHSLRVEPSKEPWGQVSTSGAQRVRPVHLGSCNPALGTQCGLQTSESNFQCQELKLRDFPGSPVVKSQLVMQGTRLDPWLGN